MISHDEDFLRLNRNRETICRLSSKEEIKKSTQESGRTHFTPISLSSNIFPKITVEFGFSGSCVVLKTLVGVNCSINIQQ